MKVLLLLCVVMFSAPTFADVCINKMRISNHEVIDSETILVHARDKYKIHVPMCFGLEFADAIGFETFSSFQICSMDDVLVIDGFTKRITSKCRISSIEKIEQ